MSWSEVVLTSSLLRTTRMTLIKQPGSARIYRDLGNPLEMLFGPNAVDLLGFQALVEFDLRALLYRDHAMQGLVSREGDVDHVVAGVQHEVHRCRLVDHAAIDRDLRALGLSLDRNFAHTGRGIAAKEPLEFAAGLDVVGHAHRLQRRRILKALAGRKRGRGGFIQIALFSDQDGV